MPTSLRRLASQRANAALSPGPSSPEAKRRSSQNAISHGLLARCVVMQDESLESFQTLLAQHLDRLQPADGLEFGMVEEMVAAHWRMRRAWAMETRMLEDAACLQIESSDAPDPLANITNAFSSLAASPALALIHRYETRFHLVYQRSLHNLLLLRALAGPNDPNPISEHSVAALPAPPEALPSELP